MILQRSRGCRPRGLGILVFVLALHGACSTEGGASADAQSGADLGPPRGDMTTPESDGARLPDAEPHTVIFKMAGIGDVKATQLTDKGGRVSWYTGQAGHVRIAFDAVSTWYELGGGLYDRRTDVYTMEPDGSDRRCLTCAIASINDLHAAIVAERVAKGDMRPGFFLGQPEWHPDGEHIIIQMENERSPHLTVNFPSFGLDNDLWLLNVKTKTASKILSQTSAGSAFLHPRFSPSGKRLIFAARNNQGLYGNQWDRWWIAVAELDVAKPASEMVSNTSFIQPNGRGFYETTGFIAKSESAFSYTFTAYDAAAQTVPPFCDEGYITDVVGSTSTKVVAFANRWDEKPRYSPSGKHLVVMSNRFDSSWTPSQGVGALTTELYLGPPGGQLRRLTDFKSLPRYQGLRLLITDHEWNDKGDKLVVQVQPAGEAKLDAHIWLLELPRAY